MNDNLKIYICHYSPYKVIDSDAFVNIQVGKAISEVKLDMLGDDTLDNISAVNATYAELTAHYWVWKNDKESDYIGFFQYRRYLTLKGIIPEQGTKISDLTKNFGWTKEEFLETFKEYDIIAPLPITSNPESIYERLCSSFGQFCIDRLIEVIKIKYPHYSNAVDKSLSKKSGCYYNMYVMKRQYFEEYSSFMFSILETMELICRRGFGFLYPKRLMSQLGERLINCYLEYAIEKYNIKVKYANPIKVIKTENGDYDFSIGYI